MWEPVTGELLGEYVRAALSIDGDGGTLPCVPLANYAESAAPQVENGR
jgi:hypothetical protein